jgi:hypothetical protein
MVKRAAAVFTLAVLTAAATALAAPTLAAHTGVVHVDVKSMHVASRESGYCWTASIASQRSDAYRCMAGNSIHDPCFKLSPSSVVCPTDPAANVGIAMSLTKPLPQPQPQSQTNAWRMELASGEMCNIGTGTTLAGYPFYCSGASDLVCAAPPPGKPNGPVFVRCARAKNGKTATPGSYLAATLYE